MQNEKSAPEAVDYYCKWSRFFIALCVLRRYNKTKKRLKQMQIEQTHSDAVDYYCEEWVCSKEKGGTSAFF